MTAEQATDFDKRLRSILGGKRSTSEGESEEEPNDTAVTKALAIFDEIIREKWHTPAREAFITITVNEVDVHMPVASSESAEYLNLQFFTRTGRPMGETTRKQVLDLLSAQCKFLGVEHHVSSRIAHHDGTIVVDLCNTEHQAVIIDPALDAPGWKVVASDKVPVRFRRNKAALPLPLPVAGGSLDLLWRMHPNFSSEDRILTAGWLMGCFQENGGRAFLEILGGQGSGKSTLGRALVSLIDPNDAPLRSMPRNEQDLIISVLWRAVAGLDNLSVIPADMADAFCRLSTGAGISTRTLYKDTEETILKAQLVLLWTAIESLATRRPDLQDRSITVRAEPLGDCDVLSEREILAVFEDIRPELLGALYNAVSVALRRVDTVQIDRLPRLADFSIWVEAAAPAFGWEEGMFIEVLESSRAVASVLAVEASAIGPLLVEFMRTRSHWEGTAGELLAELKSLADDDTRRGRSFPKDATRFSGQLRRLVQPLRAVGVWVGFDRSGRSRGVILDRNDDVYGRDAKPEPSPVPDSPKAPTQAPIAPGSGCAWCGNDLEPGQSRLCSACSGKEAA